MESKEPKKDAIKIDDLPLKPLTPEEEDATKGGISAGGVVLQGPLQGTSAPRVDRTILDAD